MQISDFRRAGHWPTLLSAFLYFDISFMVWVLIGVLANTIAPEFNLTDSQKGLMVAVPLLGGALLRMVLGPLADRIGGRRTGILGLVLTIVPLLLGWLWVDSYWSLLVTGLFLGVAGASFAVALPLASRWYPPQYQGLAMGIAGAGNSGTAVATFFGPRLAESMGWHGVFCLALIPIVLVLVIFVICAKDSPRKAPPQRFAEYVTVMRLRDTWCFCLFYAVTFGGFVGLASFLNIYFHNHYGLSPVVAGTLATVCVVAGSFLRPVGGYLADRLGGIYMLTLLYVGIGVLMLDLATAPPLIWCVCVIIMVMGLLGLGNGAVFQLVPLRFPKEVGVVTGIVGAAGGVGGFFLPTLLGVIKQLTGSYSIGFLLFGGIAFISAVALTNVGRIWEGVFVGKGGLASVETKPLGQPVLAESMES